MQDAIAGFQAAPFWVQIAMVLFATMAVVSLVGPSVRKRKFRGRFNTIARRLGADPPGGDRPFTISLDVDGRTFNVTYDFRGGRTAGSYRGPTGYLLTTSMRLAGRRWPMHQVDVKKSNKFLSRLVSSRIGTGDPDFDARFAVFEDGIPVREGWLNGETRSALVSFLDSAPLQGALWIQEGALQYIMSNPWTGLDGPVVKALLQRQAALAAVLERAGSATRP
jgi:hypothetical protein